MIKEDWLFAIATILAIFAIVLMVLLLVFGAIFNDVPTNVEIASLEEQQPTIVEQYNGYLVLGEPKQKEVVAYVAYTEDDLHWLAKIVFAEAGEDTDRGQQAVANVVLNRVASPRFPDTIHDVIWQQTAGGIWQFSPCGDGGINKEPDERAIENARLVLEGLRVLPDDVLYFYMPTEGNRGDWIRSREVVEKIGVHRFCR